MTDKEAYLYLCSMLEANIADEAEARKGYYELLATYGNRLTAKEKSDIYQIIDEEIKHSVILEQMINRLMGV